jgi:hemerythrin-like domain-containing protein
MNAMPVAGTEDVGPQSWATGSDGFVALDACHARMLANAQALEDLVATLERDGATPAARDAAAAIADFFASTARRHHDDEELHVFPALLGSAQPELVQAVQRLHQDHGWLEADWAELSPHVLAIAQGYGHCDMDTLRQGVEVFVALLRDHIALEESLIYPQARERLGQSGRRAMGREMAARRRAQHSAATR